MFDIPAEVLEEALRRAIQVLKDKHDDLGMEASGNWKDQLEGEVQTNRAVIKGARYTEQLVHGRKPGKRPPVSALEKWVEDKFGISGKRATGIAFAISNTIAEKGTTWFQKGGSDLLEVLEEKEVIDSFFSYIGAELKVIIVDRLVRDFQTLEQ